jgi:hypothetical protein
VIREKVSQAELLAEAGDEVAAIRVAVSLPGSRLRTGRRLRPVPRGARQ